jgi:hypothetical protein
MKEKPTLKVKVVKKTEYQTYYEANLPIKKGFYVIFGGIINTNIILSNFYNTTKNFYQNNFGNKWEILYYEYYGKFETKDCYILSVSYSMTRCEKLVFPAIKVMENNHVNYYGIGEPIDGKHIFMADRGTNKSIKPDYVYLRRLAMLNGYKFHYKDYKECVS